MLLNKKEWHSPDTQRRDYWKLHDLREELARVSELLDEARAADTLDPRFVGLSKLVVGLMDVDIRTLQLVDALVRHALA